MRDDCDEIRNEEPRSAEKELEDIAAGLNREIEQLKDECDDERRKREDAEEQLETTVDDRDFWLRFGREVLALYVETAGA